MSPARNILWLVLLTAGCGIAEGDLSQAASADTTDPAPDPVPTPDPQDDGDEDEDEASSLGFVPDDDVTYASTCDPFAQDCEPGHKCVPYASTGGNWDANKCVEVLGEGQIGEPCTYDGAVEATDSCDANSMCWNVAAVGDENIGTCTSFCTGSPDDPLCPAGSSCSISCDGSLNVCLHNCDPLEQDCLGSACYWAHTGFECIFTTENLEEGEPCGYVNDCAPTLACVSAEVTPGCEGSSCCASFCNLGDPEGSGCTLPGTECVPWFEEDAAPPEWEHIGICLVPGS